MLTKAKTLKGYKLNSLDGDLGKVKEFYFDDRHWAVRYLVADTGKWLTGRQVLISPYALGKIDPDNHDITVELGKSQIEKSPSIESAKPVSLQFEQSYYGYYGWPAYWNGPYVWGNYRDIERDSEKWTEPNRNQEVWDPHLRSTHAVTGYHIHAEDGDIGHVDDFIIDDQDWSIRYLVVNTSNWWSGKKVLISPQWIDKVSWSDSKVSLNLLRETVRNSPEYTENALITRDYETQLHRYYNLKGYWFDDFAVK